MIIKKKSLSFGKNIIETLFGKICKVLMIPIILELIKYSLIGNFSRVEKRLDLMCIKPQEFGSLIIFELVFILNGSVSGTFPHKFLNDLNNNVFDLIECMLGRLIIFFKFFDFNLVVIFDVFVKFILC